jgi:hypothetical protein
VYAIVGDVVREFLAHSWKVVDMVGTPVVLLQVHGTYCGEVGVVACYKAVVWDDGGFRTR